MSLYYVFAAKLENSLLVRYLLQKCCNIGEVIACILSYICNKVLKVIAILMFHCTSNAEVGISCVVVQNRSNVLEVIACVIFCNKGGEIIAFLTFHNFIILAMPKKSLLALYATFVE